MANLAVEVAGVAFKNPIIPASGVFGYGREYEKLFPLSKLGGIATKGTTGQPRPGNPAPRIAETPSGMLNSVGLQNPGIDAFLERELPNLLTKDTVILANIAGSTIDECVSIAEKLDETDVHMIELNISCPNVKKGGAAFGVHCDSAEMITAAVRKATKKPLIVKLSPNVTSITDIAKAVESAGADAGREGDLQGHRGSDRSRTSGGHCPRQRPAGGDDPERLRRLPQAGAFRRRDAPFHVRGHESGLYRLRSAKRPEGGAFESGSSAGRRHGADAGGSGWKRSRLPAPHQAHRRLYVPGRSREHGP